MMHLLILHRTSFHFTFAKSLIGLKVVAMCHFQIFLYNSTESRTLEVVIIIKSITNYFILSIYLSLRVCSFIYLLSGGKKSPFYSLACTQWRKEKVSVHQWTHLSLVISCFLLSAQKYCTVQQATCYGSRIYMAQHLALLLCTLQDSLEKRVQMLLMRYIWHPVYTKGNRELCSFLLSINKQS